MIDIQKRLTKAILIDVVSREIPRETAEKNLNELARLVQTYGGVVIVQIIQKRGRPSLKTYLGTGKAIEAAETAKEKDVDIVIVNGMLKPHQIQHLYKLFDIPVWDRVDIILKIFDKHAKTEEARLQIELARLHHEFPKLYGQGVKLSRLGGGIGTRGPGEQLLESKKRHLRSRIKEIEKKLDTIKTVRAGQRYIRKRKNLKTAALVGYTNSGKSTLLRALTKKKNVYIANELFATLDTKIGDLWLPNKREKILIADTIGFIKDLPPFLIKSFLATLEEVQEADLLLHVIDANDPEIQHKISVVDKILADLGCSTKKQIYIFNKADLIEDADTLNKLPRLKNSIKISAIQKAGLNRLKELIEKLLDSNAVLQPRNT
ncbi:GTPase HflX [Candidatus Peregrinibacteria bacterium]|nr:GTPase HflX [Candidatus Peregrinibacteria bacterium]